jgi:hypothetical protein
MGAVAIGRRATKGLGSWRTTGDCFKEFKKRGGPRINMGALRTGSDVGGSFTCLCQLA